MADKKNTNIKQQLEEMETNWKRALADYQNLVKRTQDQQNMIRNFACVSLIERLLPAMDHLKMAAGHINDPGLNMVVEQFKKALEDEGLVEIKALNQEFDPTSMECMEMVEGETNKVVEVVAEGYMIGQKTIRPAKVKVGKKETI